MGALVEVAHHGARQHDRAGGAERLDEPRDDQRLDAGRERADEARQGEQHEAAEQHGLAADPVRDRPVEELADGETEQEDRQGELRLAGRGLEIEGNRRQHGQVHVGGERPESGQKRQDGGQGERIGLEHGDRRGWTKVPRP